MGALNPWRTALTAVDRTANPQATALVHIEIEAVDLSGPVDLVLDHRTRGGHFLGFAGALGVGAVTGHKQARRGHRPDSIDHMAHGIGAAPSD